MKAVRCSWNTVYMKTNNWNSWEVISTNIKRYQGCWKCLHSMLTHELFCFPDSHSLRFGPLPLWQRHNWWQHDDACHQFTAAWRQLSTDLPSGVVIWSAGANSWLPVQYLAYISVSPRKAVSNCHRCLWRQQTRTLRVVSPSRLTADITKTVL